MKKRKLINFKNAGIALAAAVIALIFFSRTIYSYNMPVVTAVMPSRGALNKIELSSGIVTYAQEFEVYSELGGKIDAVLVKEGDSVKAGDPLVYMDFGSSRDEVGTELEKSGADTESKLTEAELNAQKISVDIEKLKLNISNTRRKIDELINESYSSDTGSDYEIKQCETDIEKAEENYNKLKKLYNAGAVPLSDLTTAERAFESLNQKLSHLKETYSEQVEDKEESRRKQISDLEYQLNAYTKDLKARKLDLQNNNSQKDKINSDYMYKTQELESKLDDYENNSVIRAAKDAVISSVSVKEGQYIGANQRLLSCGAEGDYIVECRVSIDNNFIAASDTCKLSNTSHSLNGTVASVRVLENTKLIAVSLENEGISAGETFDIKFEKNSSSSYTLVPKGALNMDSDGYYLNRIKRRDGIMGKEFYTEKLRIYIGDSDNNNVAVIKGIDFPEPVSLISDKPFSEGETVKIKNESDFFED